MSISVITFIIGFNALTWLNQNDTRKDTSGQKGLLHLQGEQIITTLKATFTIPNASIWRSL